MEATDAFKKLRSACQLRGVTGFKGLQRSFLLFDGDDSKSLNLEEFVEGLRDYGIKTLSNDEMKELFTQFDKDGSGTLNVNEFLAILQPPMNEFRTEMVMKVFAIADKTGDGVITVADLEGVYKANKNPKYLSGEKTQEEVLREYVDQFGSEDNKDGKVTKDEFITHYAKLSTSIDNDVYFDMMMRNAWEL